MMRKVMMIMCWLAAGLVGATGVKAQWTAEDSLRLKNLLNGTSEIQLNENAVRSIDFGPDFSSFIEDSTMRLNRLRFNTIVPITPAVSEKKDISLMPYNKEARKDYYKQMKNFKDNTKLMEWDGERSRKGMGMMNGTRISMMGGGVGGSFNLDYNKIFSKEFWQSNKLRKKAEKTLASMRKTLEEEAPGSFEYYYLQEYTLNFVGAADSRGKVDSLVSEHGLLRKGLLYFRYTDIGKGTFTLYLPDNSYAKGTFNKLYNGYSLLYNGGEYVLTLSSRGRSYYDLHMSLTKLCRSLYPSDDIRQVMLLNTANRVFSGNDHRK